MELVKKGEVSASVCVALAVEWFIISIYGAGLAGEEQSGDVFFLNKNYAKRRFDWRAETLA